MMTTPVLLNTEELMKEFSAGMAAYVPGVDTGGAEYTDKRSCWTKSTMLALQSLARKRNLTMTVTEHSAYGTLRQLNALWSQSGAVVLAIASGWGDREELEESFYRLLILKAPQKLLLYSCAKWKESVLEQLTSAVMRYPQHIAGETYLAVNLVASERQVFVETCDDSRDGRLTLEESRFHPLAGSPFRWGSDTESS